MSKIIKKMFSFLMIFTLCFTFIGSNTKVFADDSYSGKNITQTIEGKYLLYRLEKDARFKKENEFFKNQGIYLEKNLYSILKFEDNSSRISYIVENGDKFYEIVYIMNNSNEVILQDKKENTLLEDNKLNIKWTFDNEKFIDVIVSKDGTIKSEGVIYANDKEFVNHIMQQNNYQTKGACEFAMAILCGAGGSGGCYAICGIEAIVSRIGGLGCAVACGLIASLGCYGATLKICG